VCFTLGASELGSASLNNKLLAALSHVFHVLQWGTEAYLLLLPSVASWPSFSLRIAAAKTEKKS
jgi:hypothetical protein